MNYLFIIYAIVLQLITGFLILFIFEPIQVAQLGFFVSLFASPWESLAFIGSALLAFYGLIKKHKDYYSLLLFVPQLFFMLLSGISALTYVMQGHYADGVIRPWYFIFIDQLPFLLAVIFYIISLLHFEKEANQR